MKKTDFFFNDCTDCPVCRAMKQAQDHDRDISVVELKISFEKRREEDEEILDWNENP